MSERISFSGKIESEGRRLKGSVQVAGSRTFRDGEWLQVDPVSLMKANADNVFATVDHDMTKVMGRTTNGSLTLTRTDQGIEFSTADLPNTTSANDALELARGGYFGGASFTVEGFKPKFSTERDGTRVRTLTNIKRLVDVAIVMDPAFSNSSAAAFSKETNEVAEDTEPVVEQPAPPASFKEQPRTGKDDWAAFAAELSTDQIVTQMDGIFATAKGNLTGESLDLYEGFAKVLADRKHTEAVDKARIERMEFAHNARMGRTPKAPEAGLYASDDYAAAFGKYLRTGDTSEMAQFAQAIAGDGTQGGYTVPDGFLNRVVVRMKAFGGVQKVADSLTTADGQPLRWPSIDDTANSAVIATEGSAAGSGGADLVFGDVTLGAYTFDATGASNLPLLVSKELLQDAAIDLEGFIGDRLAERIGRKMASEFANGTGSSEPKGLFAKSADVMTATTFFAAVQEHYFQVDQAYREDNIDGDVCWLMSDTTLAKVLGSVDKNGRPLFIPTNDSSASRGPAGQMLGYPLYLDQAAGTKVSFGDHKRGFIIRYVKGVQIDVDPYTAMKSRQVAYHAWARADSNIQDANAYSVSEYSGVTADAAS
jgi:HK97 family phage major capsid protein/HK97 family phage prohead protease